MKEKKIRKSVKKGIKKFDGIEINRTSILEIKQCVEDVLKQLGVKFDAVIVKALYGRLSVEILYLKTKTIYLSGEMK